MSADTVERSGRLLCQGCGEEPLEGVVHRLEDGSACPRCCARLVEAQPSLLPAAAGRGQDGHRAETGTAAEPVAAGAGGSRFALLRGGATDRAPAGRAGVPVLDPGPPEPA